MKIQEMKQQTNEADIIGGIKKFFRQLPASAEKTERKFVNDIVKSLSSSLQRAQDFNLLNLTGTPSSVRPVSTQQRVEPTLGQLTQPNTSTQATQPAPPPPEAAAPAAPAQPPAPDAAQAKVSEPITFGGKTYRKGQAGWRDDKNKPADPNTAQFLDRALVQARQQNKTKPQPQTPATNQSITTSPNNKLGIKGLQMRENARNKEFQKLNQIFENIIMLNEADISVEDFITNRWYVPWARSIQQKHPDFKVFDSNVMTQVKTIAKEIQNSFPRDKGKVGITKLANFLTNFYYDYLNATGEQPVTSPIVSMSNNGTPQVTTPVATQAQQTSEPAQSASQPSSGAGAPSSGDASSWAEKRYGSGRQYSLDNDTVESYFDTIYRQNPTNTKQFLQKLVNKYR